MQYQILFTYLFLQLYEENQGISAALMNKGNVGRLKNIYLPSSLCQWPLRKGTVGIELHRSLYCQKPPLHHHLETGTRKTILDQTDANTVWTFETFQKLKSLTSPTSISYISTPSPHQSTARVYDVSVRTSGARNSGVPQNVLVRSPKPIPEKETKMSDKYSWFHSKCNQCDQLHQKKDR